MAVVAAVVFVAVSGVQPIELPAAIPAAVVPTSAVADAAPGNEWVAIDAGASHTCGITADGNAHCWGADASGQLGNGVGLTTDMAEPSLVAAPLGVTWASISAGGLHTCAIRTGGAEAYCWGSGLNGKLGDDQSTNRPGPSLVANPMGVTWASIGTGDRHTCGLTTGGTVYCWGFADNGRLGDGGNGSGSVDQASAVTMPVGVTFKSLSVGAEHACGHVASGVAYCWGEAADGRLGDGQTTTDRLVPHPVTLPLGVTFQSISAGSEHTCAVGATGDGYCWGTDFHGQLGNGVPTTSASTPQQVASVGSLWDTINAGDGTTCGRTGNGVLWCWGIDANGDLGNGATTGSKPAPTPVSTPAGVIFATVSAAGQHACGLTSPAFGRAAYCWGLNENGRIGAGTNGPLTHPTPVLVATPKLDQLITFTPIVDRQFSLMAFNVSATATSGLAVTFGSSTPGVCSVVGFTATMLDTGTCTLRGNQAGDAVWRPAPQALISFQIVPIIAPGTWATVSAGAYHTCAVTNSGDLYCWGDDDFGQLGNRDVVGDQDEPFLVADPASGSWVSVSAGVTHTCAVDSAGNAYCWGEALNGKLGNGSVVGLQTFPVLVGMPAGQTAWRSISAGDNHTCGVTVASAAFCWGHDGAGMLGNGPASTANRSQPSAVVTSTGFLWVNIASGERHTCGVVERTLVGDVAAYCWGTDQFEQLGNGLTTGSRDSPFLVSTSVHGGEFTGAIDAGGDNTCAILDRPAPLFHDAGISAGCWGKNSMSAIGGTQALPASGPSYFVNPGDATIIDVGTGMFHSCALRADGDLYCQGFNGFGQLGNLLPSVPPRLSEPTPVRVLVSGGIEFREVDAGWAHTCAITTYGEIRCAGEDTDGQLGTGLPIGTNGIPGPAVLRAISPIGGQLPQFITFFPIGSVQVGSAPFQITLYGGSNSGLPVVYTVSGPCTIAGTLITPTGLGTCVVTGNQAGNSQWLPGGPVSTSFGIISGVPTPKSVDRSTLQALTPARLLDTRPSGATADGLHQGAGPLGAAASRTVPVLGRGGVPATGVAAVAINVTAVAPTTSGFLTVHPSGSSRPNASNLNTAPGRTLPNMVIVPVGVAGSITVYNDTGSAQVLVDVLGWFPLGGDFTGLTPARLLDTRASGVTVDGQQQRVGALGVAGSFTLPVQGRGGVPAAGVAAVAINVTAVAPTTSGFLTVHPSGSARPNASNLNTAPGRTLPNMVIVPVGVDGSITVYNATGSVHVIVDVLGWFAAAGDFVGLTPARLLDTRPNGVTTDGVQQAQGTVGAASSITVQVLNRGGVPVAGVTAVAINVTAVAPSASGFITVHPSNTSRPDASNLNTAPGRTLPNMVIVPVAPDGTITIYNHSGATHLLVDVLGWFPPSA